MILSKSLTTAVMTLVFSGAVSAQTFTDCNPLEKTCPSEKALGNEKAECDFTAGECKVFDALPGTTVSYEEDGALFRIAKESNAPTMATHKRMFFGRLDVELKAAPGIGVVTSVVLESSDLDEIDWEWLGGDDKQVQTNYFGKGDTTTYDRGGFHDVSSPTTTFHTYSIEWTAKFVKWSIDGKLVRTLKYEEAQGGKRFPQTPMEVKIGTWVAGGKDAAEGTVQWAGGRTDFSQAPFDAYYKSVSIVDYAGGDGPSEDSVKEYVYGDNSGSWESIKVVKGQGSSDGDDGEGEDEDETHESGSTKTKGGDNAEETKAGTSATTTTLPSANNTMATAVNSAVPSATFAQDDAEAGANGVTAFPGHIAAASLLIILCLLC